MKEPARLIGENVYGAWVVARRSQNEIFGARYMAKMSLFVAQGAEPQ